MYQQPVHPHTIVHTRHQQQWRPLHQRHNDDSRPHIEPAPAGQRLGNLLPGRCGRGRVGQPATYQVGVVEGNIRIH